MIDLLPKCPFEVPDRHCPTCFGVLFKTVHRVDFHLVAEYRCFTCRKEDEPWIYQYDREKWWLEHATSKADEENSASPGKKY